MGDHANFQTTQDGVADYLRSRAGVGATTEFMTAKAAADYLRRRTGVGAWRSLAKARVYGTGPKFRKIGRRILYAREDLDAWIASRISSPMQSTSDVMAA